MKSTMRSKIIKFAIDKRINLGHDTITIDDIVNDLRPYHTFDHDQYVTSFKSHAKVRNYGFRNDRIVRTERFKIV